MELLIVYDVSTETAAGRRRLHRVAKVCEGFGQRVQKSVFECVVNAAQLEQLKARLLREMSTEEDSLRIYRLLEPRSKYVESLGQNLIFDQHSTLVV